MAKQFMNSASLRKRLGDVSLMTIWRFQKDEKLGFPRPAIIRSRRYWDADEVEAFISRRATANDNQAA